MDITLERILSLIPKGENGKFQHGALKTFANSIGLKSGNLISDWMAGKSKSYKSYLYEISAKYDVSVDWLKGETADPSVGIKKERPADGEALTDKQKEAVEFIKSLSDDDLRRFIAAAKAMLGE